MADVEVICVEIQQKSDGTIGHDLQENCLQDKEEFVTFYRPFIPAAVLRLDYRVALQFELYHEENKKSYNIYQNRILGSNHHIRLCVALFFNGRT